MYDEILQLVSELERRGTTVLVGCDHLRWMITAADGTEAIHCASARDVRTFLTGALFTVTLVQAAA